MPLINRAGTDKMSHPRLVLSILLLTYIFNYIDRQIVGVLAVPIKADLHLTDTQLGLVGGLAFGLLYTTLGIPIAWLADRWNRTNIIAGAVGVWSLFTAACGLANGFIHLFLARMGVGFGEAGGVAPAYSLISDYFPPERRAGAYAVFSLGIPIGSALGIFAGGWLAANVDWRYAFISIGLAGLPVALLVKLLIKEPERGRLDYQTSARKEETPSLLATLGHLRKNPTFWLISFSSAAIGMGKYGIMFWLPSYLTRNVGMTLSEVGQYYGAAMLVGGMAGIMAGGKLGDWLGGKTSVAFPLIAAVGYALAIPAYLIAFNTQNMAIVLIAFSVALGLGLFNAGPNVTIIQHITPPSIRATTSAAYIFITNLFGVAFGAPVIGAISDYLKPSLGDEGALRAGVLVGVGFYAVALLLTLIAARTVERDWWREKPAA